MEWNGFYWGASSRAPLSTGGIFLHLLASYVLLYFNLPALTFQPRPFFAARAFQEFREYVEFARVPPPRASTEGNEALRGFGGNRYDIK